MQDTAVLDLIKSHRVHWCVGCVLSTVSEFNIRGRNTGWEGQQEAGGILVFRVKRAWCTSARTNYPADMSALSTALCKLCCPAWWGHLAWCVVLVQCWFCAKMYAFKLSPWCLLLPPCRFAAWLVHTQNAKRHYVCPHALGFYHRVSSSCCTRTSIRSTALMVPAVWVHACCWGRMEEIQGYLLTTTISSLLVDFKDACGGVRSWVGFNLSHLLPRDCTPPWKTPPLSLCLSGSGTVMLILGLKLPSKLKGLHYWPRCISTKYSPPLPVYLNFPDYVMNTQMTEWPRWCLPSHHGGG